MTQAKGQSRSGADQTPEETQGKRQGSTARKLAEWVSLAISAVLILSIMGFLVGQVFTPEAPHVPVQARALLEKTKQAGEQYVLPVEIVNQGNQTLRNLMVEVEATEPGKEPTKYEVEIDYLGEGARQEAYLYLPVDPRTVEIEVTPLRYSLE